jgi:hypothetical protein
MTYLSRHPLLWLLHPKQRTRRGEASQRSRARSVPNDVTVNLIREDFGHRARGYVKADAADADLETVVRNFISGR